MVEHNIHVVFGAGQIGPLLAARLRTLGKPVRIVRRSAGPVPLDGIEVVRGDAMDAAFCEEAARGAETVYHCLNTAYFARVWREPCPECRRTLSLPPDVPEPGSWCSTTCTHWAARQAVCRGAR